MLGDVRSPDVPTCKRIPVAMTFPNISELRCKTSRSGASAPMLLLCHIVLLRRSQSPPRQRIRSPGISADVDLTLHVARSRLTARYKISERGAPSLTQCCLIFHCKSIQLRNVHVQLPTDHRRKNVQTHDATNNNLVTTSKGAMSRTVVI